MPIGPNPTTCPCFLMKNKEQNPGQIQQSNGQYVVIGFIPVVFFPKCQDSPTNHTDVLKPAFPEAQHVPYPCGLCTPEGGAQNIDPALLNKAFSAFQQVLAQSNLPENTKVISPSRKQLSRFSK